MTAPCEYREWDSAFFGRRIAQVTAASISAEDLVTIHHWCGENAIDCLYVLADPNSHETTNLLETDGFHLMDVRVTLEYTARNSVRIKRPPIDRAITLRGFVQEDLPYLKEMVVGNHHHSRFFRDPRFRSDGYHRLYTYWIEKECREEDVKVFIAMYGDLRAGYMSCKVSDDNTGHIGLGGVNSTVRNRGIGTLLVEHALAHLAEAHCGEVRVVTQGANIDAERLYTSNGFYPVQMQLWYHKWFSRAETDRR